MSAKIKPLIIAFFGLIVAIVIGAQVGQSARLIPLIVTVGCVGTFIYVALFRTVRFEALVLGCVLLGYIIGNRGFAQLTIREGSPLFVGEVAMLLCACLVLPRAVLTRERLVPQIPLAWSIVAFLILGGVRLSLDTVFIHSSNDVSTAIRDSAAVYYALFFFISYHIGRNLTGRKFIERVLLVAFLLLIPVAAIEIWFSGFFERFAFRGYPLIQHKGDLLATFLAMGAFYFFLRPVRGGSKIFFRICSLTSLVLMLFPMSRAALIGFAVATGLLLIARRPQFLLYQVSVAVLALATFLFLEFADVRVESDLFGKLTDRIVSIVDLSGSGDYRGSIGDMSVANTQFRTIWWKTVFNETIDKSPWFGLGFGYDLSASFIRTYYSNQQQIWDTRSPHSIWMTVFGRMGILGALSFSTIILLMLRDAFRAARAVAHGRADSSLLANWCPALALFCSAMFGVVLEGPMGGILFWTFLGLAVSQRDEIEQIDEPEGHVGKIVLEPALAARA